MWYITNRADDRQTEKDAGQRSTRERHRNVERVLYLPAPIWVIGLAMALIAAAIAVVGMFIVRERVHKLVTEGHNDVAGFFFATVGVVYAVLLAFQVFAVWERYGAADSQVQDAASAEINLLRLTVAMPPDLAKQLQGHLKNYAELVVNVEWNLMATGGASIRARDEMNIIARLVDSWNPQTPADVARYTELLADMDQFSNLRNIMNFSARGSLPDAFWYVLVAGGIVTVGFTWLFHMENSTVQALMVGTTAALLTSCLFLILALNQPFAGPARVSPDPFVHMLDHFADFYKPMATTLVPYQPPK